MTTRLLILADCVALVLLGITVYLTRATLRRVVGALIGGFTVTALMAGVDALARERGWWSYPNVSTPYGLTLLYVAAALWYGAGVALIGWRLTRRFGWRGLVGLVGAATVLGPVRDYAFAALTGVIVFAPGTPPALLDAACWGCGIALVQGVMRLVAGPARSDRLRQARKIPLSIPSGG
jgi:hypothetical protein